MSNLKQHFYRAEIVWTGNKGIGTSSYRAYGREYTFKSDQKLEILCSSDPSFLGDASRYNPEELFLSSIAGCHMLWFLSLAAQHGFVVDHYRDAAEGVMGKNADGKLMMKVVTLHPEVQFSGDKKPSSAELAHLHHLAHDECFIANSVKTEVRCVPR